MSIEIGQCRRGALIGEPDGHGHAGQKDESDDTATVEVLVGRDHGENGFRRVDVEITPLIDGSLKIEAQVPASLAKPVMALVDAFGLKAGRRAP